MAMDSRWTSSSRVPSTQGRASSWLKTPVFGESNLFRLFAGSCSSSLLKALLHSNHCASRTFKSLRNLELMRPRYIGLTGSQSVTSTMIRQCTGQLQSFHEPFPLFKSIHQPFCIYQEFYFESFLLLNRSVPKICLGRKLHLLPYKSAQYLANCQTHGRNIYSSS